MQHTSPRSLDLPGCSRLSSPLTTASSQKKRRLAPSEISPSSPIEPDTRHLPTLSSSETDESLVASDARCRSSPSPTSPDIAVPSSASSFNSRLATPPRFLPPHLHDEVLPSREEGTLRNLTLPDSSIVVRNSVENMSGVEEAREGSTERQLSGVGRAISVRSASPAKRTAADMEDAGITERRLSGQAELSTGNEAKNTASESHEQDSSMHETLPSTEDDSQNTLVENVDISMRSTFTQDSQISATASGNPPPYSARDPSQHPEQSTDYSSEHVDEQVRHVQELCAKPLDEGQRGALISTKWLARVMSRSSEGRQSTEYTKEAREGPVGPLDNSDILPTNAYAEPILHDNEKTPFIAIHQGLQSGQDFEIVPWDAYSYIVSAYGTKHEHPIVRYVHDTAPADATVPNLMYEVYPPVITVRKVPLPSSPADIPSKSRSSAESLRLKKEREARGQRTPNDAVRLVSSRIERFKAFLIRAKEGAGIPRATKVKLWRVLDAKDVTVDEPSTTAVDDSAVSLSSNQASAGNPDPLKPELILDTVNFAKMEESIDYEFLDARDETNNDKYNGKMNMELVGLFSSQTIILEEQAGGPGDIQLDSKKGSKPQQTRNAISNAVSAPASGRTSPAPGMVTRGRLRRDGRTRGTVGLTNLGNTCYMNSALQCIRSVEELATYFLSNAYKKEINNDNPLGHHGAMANSYATLLRGIYSETATGAFTPTQFKRTLGSLQPLFSGYGQQDSQEFLSFLVDALHEDLNRIVKKPYNENPDSDDKTVHDPQAIIDLGNIYRKNHRARNDSIAMDLFSGFYKNTMECPVCDKISITFDPFSLLTVQLPIENTFQHNITFIPLNFRPINHALDMDKHSSIKSIKEHVARRHPGVDASRLWMVEVYGHKIYKVFEDQNTIAEVGIQANDNIFLYELEAVPKNLATPKRNTYSSFSKSSDDSLPSAGMESPKADCFSVPIFHRTKVVNRRDFSMAMHPLYITLTREEAKDYQVILKKTLLAVSQISSRPFLREVDSEAGSTNLATSESDVPPGSRRSPGTNSGEDFAGVSDHSAQSEDGYVSVTIEKPSTPAGMQDTLSDKMQVDEPDNDVFRARFLDPGYTLSNALRDSLFELKYARASDNLHYTGMTSISDSSVTSMVDRVVIKPRRSSSDSSSDDAHSSSTESPPERANDESEESDADDLDKPDIVLGESTLSAATVEDSEEEGSPVIMEPSPVENAGRSGRRRTGKKQKWQRNKRGNRQGTVTYGGANKPRMPPSRIHAADGPQSHADSPYYIKLGEAIVLDWRPEAFDSLFEGDADVADDMRGHHLTHDEGKHVQFFHDAEVEAKRKRREDRKRNGINLEDCFAETGKREVLSEDNAWYCNRCKEMRRAAKTLEIWTIPDILVVHLKRFGGTRSFRDKLDVFVDYPIEGLDMTDKIGLKEDGKEYLYDLFAVDNHYGGLGGGHYTAMAKNIYDGEWYDYNDSTCSKIGRDAKLHSAAAYLLFYRRRSDKPLGPPYLQDLVTVARNPSALEEPADSESGEGKLGGPIRSLQHGSSSALTEAGAEATNSRKGLDSAAGGPIGAPAPADSSLTTKLTTTTTTTTNNDDDINDNAERVGNLAPGLLTYATRENDGWSFASLNNDHPATPHVNDDLEDDVHDDVDSTIAEHDNDSALGNDSDAAHTDRMDEDIYSDPPEYAHAPFITHTTDRNTPMDLVGDGVYDVVAALPPYATLHHHHPPSSDHAMDEDTPAVDIHIDGDDSDDPLNTMD